MATTLECKGHGSLTSEQRQILNFLLGLPPARQKRVIELCELHQVAETDRDRAEIEAIIVEFFDEKPDGINAVEVTSSDGEARAKLARHRKYVAEQISRQRRKLRLSQQEVAKRAGLTQSHISRLEKGVHSPTYLTLEKVADALETTPAALDPGFDD